MRVDAFGQLVEQALASAILDHWIPVVSTSAEEVCCRHFGAELVGGGDWNLYIEKDGSRMAEQAFTINLPNVFRKRLRFGESNFSFDSDLEGVVLGFRLDRGIVS